MLLASLLSLTAAIQPYPAAHVYVVQSTEYIFDSADLFPSHFVLRYRGAVTPQFSFLPIPAWDSAFDAGAVLSATWAGQEIAPVFVNGFATGGKFLIDVALDPAMFLSMGGEPIKVRFANGEGVVLDPPLAGVQAKALVENAEIIVFPSGSKLYNIPIVASGPTQPGAVHARGPLGLPGFGADCRITTYGANFNITFFGGQTHVVVGVFDGHSGDELQVTVDPAMPSGAFAVIEVNGPGLDTAFSVITVE